MERKEKMHRGLETDGKVIKETYLDWGLTRLIYKIENGFIGD